MTGSGSDGHRTVSCSALVLFLIPHWEPSLGLLSKNGGGRSFHQGISSSCHLHQRSVFIFWRPKDFFPNTAVDPYLSVQEKVAEMEGTPLASDYLREWDRFFENRHFSHPSLTLVWAAVRKLGKRVAWPHPDRPDVGALSHFSPTARPWL